MEYISQNINDTHKIAITILKSLMNQANNKSSLLIILKGELGAGKTEFVKGFKSFLQIKNNILSPTFVLMKVYNINNHNIHFKKFYHLDLYRLIDANETEIWNDLETLNIKDILNDEHNIVCIEWGEKLKTLRKTAKIITIKPMANQNRIISAKIS